MCEELRWYVLRTVFHGELKVRDGFRRAGLRCFVPLKWELKTLQGHKLRKLVPAISGLVFVRGLESDINEYKVHTKDTVYWTMCLMNGRREKLTVTDKVMDNFIRITQQEERNVSYYHPDEISLSRGDHIIIHGGPFDGIEGILLKVKGRRERQLVVSIPSVCAAAVSLSPEVVEVKNRHTTSSNNMTHDSRELIRLSTQLLTAAPDKVTDATEYNMLFSEVRRLYESLYMLRGYLRDREGELVLSLLMAEHVLGLHNVGTVERFRKAMAALGIRSLLKLRMAVIGGSLLHDVDLLTHSRQEISRIKTSAPSERQLGLIREMEKWQGR